MPVSVPGTEYYLLGVAVEDAQYAFFVAVPAFFFAASIFPDFEVSIFPNFEVPNAPPALSLVTTFACAAATESARSAAES